MTKLTHAKWNCTQSNLPRIALTLNAFVSSTGFVDIRSRQPKSLLVAPPAAGRRNNHVNSTMQARGSQSGQVDNFLLR